MQTWGFCKPRKAETLGEVGFRAVSPLSVPLITGNVVWKEVESSASGWGLSVGEKHKHTCVCSLLSLRPGPPCLWEGVSGAGRGQNFLLQQQGHTRGPSSRLCTVLTKHFWANLGNNMRRVKTQKAGEFGCVLRDVLAGSNPCRGEHRKG